MPLHEDQAEGENVQKILQVIVWSTLATSQHMSAIGCLYVGFQKVSTPDGNLIQNQNQNF